MNQEQWREFLNKSSITNKEWNYASSHANWWCTCAVGSFLVNDSSLKPTYNNGEQQYENDSRFLKLHGEVAPKYKSELYTLGIEFGEVIDKKNQSEALHIYNKITLIV